MGFSLFAFALLIVCSVAQQEVPTACVANEHGPACPRRGAAMIQRAPQKAPMKASAPLRADGEAPRVKQYHGAEIMTLNERGTVNAKAKAMGKQAAAVQIMLTRAMGKVRQTPLPENELDQLIYNLMKEQSSGGDACPAKLLEAKHQLNQLHKHMYTVAYEINSSSREVLVTSKSIETLEAEWTTEQKECSDGKEKCTTEITWYKEQWEILKWELIEMRQIGNPSITITASDMSYAAWKSTKSSEEETKSNLSDSWSDSTEEEWNDFGSGAVPSYKGPGDKPSWWPTLLQATAASVSAPTNTNGGGISPAEAVSALVKRTKEHSKELEHCFSMFQQRNGETVASMLAKKGKNGQPTEISGTFGTGDKGSSYSKVGDSNKSSYDDSASNDSGGWGNRGKSNSSEESSSEEDWSRSLTNTSSSFSNVSEDCKIQLIAFERTYYKAYKQVTRLVSEYEVLVNSTECEDAVDEGCKEQDAEYSIKSKKETERLSELTEKMMRIKGHITVTSNQEKALTVHIKQLTETCMDLDETVSDLDKVRDAIMVFGVCAGLGRPNFHIPKFAKFVEIEYDTSGKSDDQTDFDFQKVCLGANLTLDGHNARAAETSEIMQQAIEGMPATNTAGAVVMGVCPHCNGQEDQPGGPSHASGHFRTCWDAGAALDGATMRDNCGHLSYKAIMCVFDKFDVVTSTGEVTNHIITSGGSSSSSSSSGSSTGGSSTSSSSSSSSTGSSTSGSS